MFPAQAKRIRHGGLGIVTDIHNLVILPCGKVLLRIGAATTTAAPGGRCLFFLCPDWGKLGGGEWRIRQTDELWKQYGYQLCPGALR